MLCNLKKIFTPNYVILHRGMNVSANTKVMLTKSKRKKTS